MAVKVNRYRKYIRAVSERYQSRNRKIARIELAQSNDCGSVDYDCGSVKPMKKTLIFLCFVTFIGCTKTNVPDGFPKLIPVTLTLAQDGTPLAGATVSLNGDSQFSVGGVTDARGNVILYTHGKHKGAPLGKYKVRVTKTESDPGPPSPKSFSGPEFEAWRKEYGHLPPPKTYTLVEKQYTQVATTPLEIDVTGPLTQTLDVGRMVKDVM